MPRSSAQTAQIVDNSSEPIETIFLCEFDGVLGVGTAILFVLLGEVPFEKGTSPRPPPRKLFDNLGHNVIVYKFTEIILLLVVWNHRDAPPNGTLLPNRRLVGAWLFEFFGFCFTC